MVEKFESDGYWWLPGQENVKVPGKFIYNSEQGLILDLNDAFYCFAKLLSWEPSIFPQGETQIILGLLNDGKPITLYQCYGRTIKEGWGGNLIHHIRFNPNFALIGVFFENKEDDKKIKLFKAQLSYLEDWVDISGLIANLQNDNEEIIISYKKPSTINLGTVNNLKLDIGFSPVEPLTMFYLKNDFQAQIKQITYFKIENRSLKSLEDCLKILINFCEFISFTVKTPVEILSLIGKVDVQNAENENQEKSVRIFVNRRINNNYYQNRMNIHPLSMLFTYHEVKDEIENIFKKWLLIKDNLKIICELLFINIYTPQLYLEYQFINIIQALEAYHSNSSKYQDKYISKNSFKHGIKQQLKNLIERYPSQDQDQELGISDEFKKVLINKLDFLNSFTLKSRLFDLVKRVSPLLPDQFIGDLEERKKFMSKAANIRHALTHHDEDLREKIPSSGELKQITLNLTLILQTCLLQELGLSEEKIKYIMNKRMPNLPFIKENNTGQ
ncbi:HEPN domain-containing protein [Gloeothece citriformis]|nr:HEPN domain-containing protein [Gloeothece citriformis]